MDIAVRQLKEVARQIDERVEFSVPFVDRFAHDCDGQGESVYVVVHVLIPPEWDGFEFRDRFFGRLADAIAPEDGMRLAVGVRYRG